MPAVIDETLVVAMMRTPHLVIHAGPLCAPVPIVVFEFLAGCPLSCKPCVIPGVRAGAAGSRRAERPAGGWWVGKRRRGCARAACRTLSSGDEPLIFVRDGDFVSTFQTFTAPVRGPAVIVGFLLIPWLIPRIAVT